MLRDIRQGNIPSTRILLRTTEVGVKITNRTDKTLTIHVTAVDRSPFPFPAMFQTWFGPGQSWDEGVGQASATVSVEPGKISGDGKGGGFTFPWNPMVKDAGPYPNTHELLLVNGGRTIVDWTQVRAKYVSETQAITAAKPEAPNPEVQQGLAVASAVIAACATGLAALGPVGAAPATIMQLLAAMISISTPQEAPPKPPDIDEIERVIERVVAQQSEKDFARKAANSFLLAQQWLLDMDATFREAAKAPAGAGKGQRRDPVDDFYDHLERWVDANGDFRGHIHDMIQHPETAKWIIPAFLAGVGAHLQIWRLHAVANHKTGRVTIEQFQREVDTCSKALIAAATAWWGYVLKRLKDDSIYGTPEGDWAYHILNETYVGAAVVGPSAPSIPGAEELAASGVNLDTTPIGSAVFHLNQIHKYLGYDLQAIDSGKPATYFYKPAWDEAWEATELSPR